MMINDDSIQSPATPAHEGTGCAVSDVMSGFVPQDPISDFKEPLANVGVRLRDARVRAGLSLRSFSKQSGLSTSFLSLVERGECSLSLTSLFTIANTLGISPAEILDDAVSPLNESAAMYSRWQGFDASHSHIVVGEREYFPFTPSMNNRVLEPLFFRIYPTTIVSPMSSHDGEEVCYVVSGSLYIRLRNEELTLSAGESIHFASNVPHTIANLTSTAVEALWITARSFSDENEPPNQVATHTI